MQSAAARMQELIDGLLTLSRVTTPGARTSCPSIWREVAREVVSDLEVQIEQVGGRVEVGKLPTIQADPLQMRQLLQNLIGNALKFHRVDEPPVVKIEGRYVHGREQRQAGRVGRPRSSAGSSSRTTASASRRSTHERIFGIFQRLHPRDVYEGTGIGLAMCRKIVEHHGGTITARSTPGKGSIFEVLLPVVASRKNERGLSDGRTAPGTSTILMADDDAEDCLLVREALRETGRPCDLRIVRDGEELFDYLHRRGRVCRRQRSPRGPT